MIGRKSKTACSHEAPNIYMTFVRAQPAKFFMPIILHTNESEMKL